MTIDGKAYAVKPLVWSPLEAGVEIALGAGREYRLRHFDDGLAWLTRHVWSRDFAVLGETSDIDSLKAMADEDHRATVLELLEEVK